MRASAANAFVCRDIVLSQNLIETVYALDIQAACSLALFQTAGVYVCEINIILCVKLLCFFFKHF
ncbi:hypothetical protein X975_26980, partial [Stegodyphus mimosarum]